MLTKLKPALRATLVVLGEPAPPTWAGSYDDLAQRLARYDRALAAALIEVITAVPGTPDREVAVGEALLDVIPRLAAIPAVGGGA